MTKVKVPHVWVVDYSDKPEDRPIYYSFESSSYFYLPNDLHFWLVEHNIRYILADEKGWVIVFEKVEDAILFKLTWG